MIRPNCSGKYLESSSYKWQPVIPGRPDYFRDAVPKPPVTLCVYCDELNDWKKSKYCHTLAHGIVFIAENTTYSPKDIGERRHPG
jgi:hypothetical protein